MSEIYWSADGYEQDINMDENRVEQREAARIRFGERVKACRIAAGYPTAKAFADSFPDEYGVNSYAYRRYERGEVTPDIWILAELARRLRQSIDFLVTGKYPLHHPPLSND